MIYPGLIVNPYTSIQEINTKYVDDNALVKVSKSAVFIIKRLNKRMAECIDKASLLNVKYEPQKSDLVFFRPTTSTLPQFKNSITIAGTEVHPKEFLKYIRVCLDSTLSFRPQIVEAISKGL
jgi:hypothetical protein